MTSYTELRKLNVNDKIEKKNGLSYLSWAFAVDTLLQADETATWEYLEDLRYGDTVMVRCAVTAFGRTRVAQLPVMDHRNKAIANPDSFQVNTAMQRCLAKAIALHGIGLYIYAGEDLPAEGADPRGDLSGVQAPLVDRHVKAIADILAMDADENAIAQMLRDHVAEHLQPNNELYISVADGLAEKGVISKANFKRYLLVGMERKRA
ncbi:MAG TPA: DUF1071 domain-containing protein [Xanthobacteraceae bacterium]|jgi:hypothetical protein|nr:DUF1071 domain-containing protein [Xanthobacteraceae bacterium]